MSLRSKILAVYLPISLAPLLVVGVANYARYAALTDRLLDAELSGAAEQAARHIASRHGELQAELLRVAASPRPAAAAAQSPVFRRVELVERGGRVRVLASQAGVRAESCDPGMNEVRIAVPVDAQAGTVAVGRVPLEALVPASVVRGGSGDVQALVVDRSDGTLLFDPSCPGAAPSASALADASGLFTFEADGRERTAAYVRLSSPDWTVVLSAPTGTLSLAQQGAAVVLALLVFGLVGGLIFHVATGRLLRSLEQVMKAADRIGEGDFTPWLPPPGDDETGRLSQALGSMVVRLKRLMQETERNRQLAVVGEVSSHLAHEIRNPLSAITLNLQSVKREVRRGSVPRDLPEVLDVCLTEIGRLESVVENVLRLGRADSGTTRDCGLHDLVDGALAVLGPQLGAKRIVVDTWYLAEPDTVRCDAEQMHGVVLNLLRNAGEAMPDGGALRIWTTRVEPLTGGPLIRLHIADEGPGVAPELRERIFDPFFTTKPNGSGIGLASAADAAAAAGGRLFIEKRSELEQGAEFVLELPLVLPAVQDTKAAGGEAGRGAGRTGTKTRAVAPRRRKTAVPA